MEIKYKCYDNWQALYLIDGEKYQLKRQQFIIPADDPKSNITQLLNDKTAAIGLEQFRFLLSFNFSRMLIYSNYEGSEHQICFANSSCMQCKFSISNYLQDEQAIIKNEGKTFIGSYFNNCTHIYNYKSKYYLLIFQNNLIYQAKILDENNNVLHQIAVEAMNGYQLDVAFLFPNILFYEMQTVNSTLFFYTIQSSNKFCEEPVIRIIEGNQYSSKSGNLIHIFWTNSDTCTMVFEYGELILKLRASAEFPPRWIPTQENYRIFGHNQQFIVGTDNNLDLDKQFEIKFDSIRLSNKTEIPQQAFYINQHIILVYNSSLLIEGKEGRGQIINNIIFANQLETLPIIITLSSDNVFRVIYINSQPSYFTNEDKKPYIFAVQKVPIMVKDNKISYSTLYELKTYSVDFPEIILKNESQFTFIMGDQDQTFLDFSAISLGLPTVITQILNYKNNNVIAIINKAEQLMLLSYRINHNNFILSFISKSIFCITEYNQTIQAFIYDLKNYRTLQINEDLSFFTNLTNTYLYSNGNFINAIQIEPFFISVFSLSQDLSIFQQISRFYFDSEISQVKQIENSVFFILKNCTSYQFYLDQIAFSTSHRRSYSLFLQHCGGSESSSENQIQLIFSTNRIAIKLKNSYFRTFSFTNIIDHDYIQKSLIIYELIRQIVVIKHYFFDNNNLHLFYQFPTYQFNIKYPMKRITSQIYLAIAANKDDKEFILVYKFFNQAVNVLLQIIEIDENTSFNFCQQSLSLYYVHNRIVQYRFLGKVEIQLDLNLVNYFETMKVQINFESQISSQHQNLSTQFMIINQIHLYKLQLKSMSIKYSVNSNVINLTKVKGNVVDIHLIDEINNCQLIKPIISLNTSNIACYSYQEGYCLNLERTFISNIFQEQVLFGNFNDIEEIVQLIVQSQTYAVIIYINQQQLLMKQSGNIIQSRINRDRYVQLLQQTSSFSHLEKKVNELFLFRTSIVEKQIIAIFEDRISYIHVNGENYFGLADIFAINGNYLICTAQADQDQITISFLAMNFLNQIDVIVNLIEDQYQPYKELLSNIQELTILSVSKEDNILKTEIFFFSSLHQGYLYEIEISLLARTVSVLNLKNIIRYGPKIQFISVLYLTEKYIILQQRSLGSAGLYLYDTHNRNNYQIIDSKYRLEINSIALYISKYNSSVYTLLSAKYFSQQQKVNLEFLKIGGDYQLECRDKKNHQILIENELSNLTVILQPEEIGGNNTQSRYKFLILLINLIAIFALIGINQKQHHLVKE